MTIYVSCHEAAQEEQCTNQKGAYVLKCAAELGQADELARCFVATTDLQRFGLHSSCRQSCTCPVFLAGCHRLLA